MRNPAREKQQHRGLGHVFGLPVSLSLLAVLPLAGLAVLVPDLRRPRQVA